MKILALYAAIYIYKFVVFYLKNNLQYEKLMSVHFKIL